MLTVIDEHSRECLALHVQRKLNSDDVLVVLTGLFARHGPPAHIRSDNGAEFTAHAVRNWLERIGVKTLYIKPGSPWENGTVSNFVREVSFVHQTVNLSPKIMANSVLALNHSRGGRFHCSAA